MRKKENNNFGELKDAPQKEERKNITNNSDFKHRHPKDERKHHE